MNNFFDLDANIFGYSPLKKNTDKRNLSNSCPQMKSFDSGTFQKKIKWESSSIRKPQNDLSCLLFRGKKRRDDHKFFVQEFHVEEKPEVLHYQDYLKEEVIFNRFKDCAFEDNISPKRLTPSERKQIASNSNRKNKLLHQESKNNNKRNLSHIDELVESLASGFIKEGIHTPKKQVKIENSQTPQSSQKQKKPSVNKNEIAEIGEEEKRNQFQLEMKKTEKERIESLLSSISKTNLNSTPDFFPKSMKPQRDIDSLLKLLLSYEFKEQLSLLPTTIAPDEFSNHHYYQQVFQPLITNECVTSIKNSLKLLLKQQSELKPLKCYVRMLKNEFNDGDFTTLEIDVPNENENNDEKSIIYQLKYLHEIFDVSIANNYIVLISSSPNITLEEINKPIYTKGLAIMGFLGSREKSNCTEYRQILTTGNFMALKQFFKKEWNVCYFRPIQKITTFLREYSSLDLISSSNMLNQILTPKILQNRDFSQIDTNEIFYTAVKYQFNASQLNAIKNVCLSSDKISLLQGPPGTGKTHALLGIVSGIFQTLQKPPIGSKRYIMICAPSNAALDEIIFRIQRNGIFKKNGKTFNPKVVRVGILEKEAHNLVKKCSLEEIVLSEMNKTKDGFMNGMTIHELRDNIDKIQKKIEVSRIDPGFDKQSLTSLYEKRQELFGYYHNFTKWQISQKEKYCQFEQNVLYSADIICCTLSSAGSKKLDRFKDFIEAVIVDEATQCTETSILIPLRFSPNKVILIGDPKQLPPSTFSQNSFAMKYNRSLFERIISNGIKPFFLEEQYRMIANIRAFPSLQFYEDRLKDALSVQQRKFPSYLQCFENQNVIFLDLKYSKENYDDYSYYNIFEVNAVFILLEEFFKTLTDKPCDLKNTIGCITPYRKQATLLNEKLREKYKDTYKNCLTINTVDAFQGQEKDMIIFSTVRANSQMKANLIEQNLIGFLNDVRRLNVAITRAKFVLIILGNSRTLMTNSTWKNYIEHLVQNKCYFEIQKPGDIVKTIQNIRTNTQTSSLEQTKINTLTKQTHERIEDKKEILHSHSSSAKSSLSKASTVESSGSSSGDVSTIIKKESNNTLKINIKRIFTEQISNFKAFSDQDKSEEKVEIIKKKVKCEELVQSSCSGTKSLFEEEFHSKSKKVQQFNKEAPPKSGLASLFQKTPQKKNSENSFSLLNDLLGI